MSNFVKESLSKGERSDAVAADVLKSSESLRPVELRHGDWIEEARKKLKSNTFANPTFALLLVFLTLFCGSIYLFEHMQVLAGPLCDMPSRSSSQACSP